MKRYAEIEQIEIQFGDQVVKTYAAVAPVRKLSLKDRGMLIGMLPDKYSLERVDGMWVIVGDDDVSEGLEVARVAAGGAVFVVLIKGEVAHAVCSENSLP